MASNLYSTLSDFKDYVTARNQISNSDVADDGVINDLLEQASRYLDDKTNRQFYPSVETRSYDVPNGAELLLDQDLLSITTLTNGDDTTISSANYILHPANITPYYSIELRDTSTVAWEADSNEYTQQVIDVTGWWGYRNKYSTRAWVSVGTLGAAISDTTTLAFTMTAGHTIKAGNILKIDNEIYNIATVSTNAITPNQRGDNGSTAATHTNGSTVYKWVPQEGAEMATLEIANAAYKRRFGMNVGETARVTAAGVVLTPRDIPKTAEEFIRSFMRLV